MAIVTLYDVDEVNISTWARKNCPSFLCWLVYESQDINEEWYMQYNFEFGDEHDAMLFQLKWAGHGS